MFENEPEVIRLERQQMRGKALLEGFLFGLLTGVILTGLYLTS